MTQKNINTIKLEFFNINFFFTYVNKLFLMIYLEVKHITLYTHDVF